VCVCTCVRECVCACGVVLLQDPFVASKLWYLCLCSCVCVCVCFSGGGGGGVGGWVFFFFLVFLFRVVFGVVLFWGGGDGVIVCAFVCLCV